MRYLMWNISNFFSMLWQIFAILCKSYILIGFIVVLLFLSLMILSFIVIHDEFMEAINEAMSEFNFDDSTSSFIVFFLFLSLFILFAYPIIIIGLLQSDDWYRGIIMNVRDKLNKLSNKIDLFPELSLCDKLQNRLIVFGVNIFNWIKNMLLKLHRI